MAYFILFTCALALYLTLASRNKSKSAAPIASALTAYGIALIVDGWHALGLPLPRIGTWVSNFSRPIAGMIYDYLQ